MESLVSIWKPTGKEPSGLWQGEANSFNDVFMDLAEYFEQHETYCYSFRSWDPADSIVHSHSTMTISRIAKWLTYCGVVDHRTEHRSALEGTREEDEEKTLFHALSPTLKMRQVFEKGELLKVGRSYSEPQTVGVGRPYPSYDETVKWLNSTCEQNKVAKYRRDKSWADFNRLYNQNLSKTKEEMHKLMADWLNQLIASIPTRGRKAKFQAQLEQGKYRSLEAWQ